METSITTTPDNLLISEVFPPQHGGSGRWFWEIYRRLPRERVAIVAGLHPQAKIFDASHDLLVTRCKFAMQDWGLLARSSLSAYWRLHSHCATAIKAWPRRPKATLLVHAGRCLPEGWLAWSLARRFGYRYVVYVHGEDINTYATSRQLRFLTRRVLNGAQIVIANSQNTAALLTNNWGLAAERVAVLYPGVDSARFHPAAPDEGFRRQQNWHDRRVVLTAGRLQLRKGHDRFIESLPRIQQAIPNVLYAIIGDGEERPRLERLADELGVREQVRFYSEVSDEFLVQAYQQCDLFVLPNRTVGHDIEGFGMVLLEAQACGKAVVAGDSGGTRETMRPGVTGTVVDCTAPEIIATEITRLLADRPRLEAMGSAARDWVVDNFDWKALFQHAAELFSRAAGLENEKHIPSSCDAA